jgi:uncharacterized protein
MAHPVIHAEIRSADPDATRAFFAELFGWSYSDGAFPGYTFVDTGVEGAIATAIGPVQEGDDVALFFVGVADVEATLARAQERRRPDDSAGATRAGRQLWRLRRRAGPRHRRRSELRVSSGGEARRTPRPAPRLSP